MNYLRLIISLAITIFPVIVLIRDWKFNDKRTRKYHQITRFIIILWSTFSIVATCFVLSDSSKIDELIQGKNTLINQNKELIKQNNELIMDISKYQEENKYLKSEIEKARRGISESYDFNGVYRKKSGGISKTILDENSIFTKLTELEKDKKYIEIINITNLNIKRIPTWFTLYFYRGIAYANTGEISKAMIDFKYFLENASDDMSYSEAIEDTKRFITIINDKK